MHLSILQRLNRSRLAFVEFCLCPNAFLIRASERKRRSAPCHTAAFNSPIKIGAMEVPNRFVVPPMGNNFANSDGSWSDQSRAYYEARAAGGFGLITIEATVVHRGAKGGPLKPCLYSDDSIPSLRAVVDACHRHGAKVSVQLQNAGPEGNAKNAGAPLQAASPIPAACGRDVPEEVPTRKVYELVQGYGDAAERALRAGVDAVEVHMAHGYLVSSFISPRTNKRVDEFGGSFENRMRFPRLILEEVRRRVGDRVAVLCRINAADEEPGGIDVNDACVIARYLEECGADALHVSRAVHLRDEFMWAPTSVHAGFNADLVAKIKGCISIPVISVGRFTDPYLPELLIEQGKCDLVAFGRQSLADPEMPRKYAEGREEDTMPCIACLQGCVANMYAGKPIRCLVNPRLGHECETVPAAVAAKRIVVIGGGVAGLAAAAISSERGHDVILLEEAPALGGNMRLASFPPGKGPIADMVRSWVVRAQKAGVEVRLGVKGLPDDIAALQPDEVVVATGARALLLPIEGIDCPAILRGGDVLAGKAYPGKNVLIAGGGMVGCEIADLLAELGHSVTVAEYRENLAADMVAEHRNALMRSFAEHGVCQVPNAKICRFYADGVEYENTLTGQLHELRGFDSVVLAMGYVADDRLSEALVQRGISVHVVGDAVKARRAIDALREAYELAVLL